MATAADSRRATMLAPASAMRCIAAASDTCGMPMRWDAQLPSGVARVPHGVERGAVGDERGGEVQPDGLFAPAFGAFCTISSKVLRASARARSARSSTKRSRHGA